MGCRGLGHEIGSEGSMRAGGLAFLALGQISSRFWGAGPPKSALLDTLPYLSLRWRNEWSPAATYAEVANIRRRGRTVFRGEFAAMFNMMPKKRSNPLEECEISAGRPAKRRP